MCSWCWGMAPAISEVVESLGDRISFDIRLGGINTDSVRPVGAYGRRRLDRLWDEVTEVTGQTFSHQLPEGTVYNSQLPCLALEGARDISGAPPFLFTHRLQQLFFEEGVNINDQEVLIETAEEFGIEPGRLRERMRSTEVRTRTEWGFTGSRRYGTNALPSVVVSDDGSGFRLFAGGYVSAAQLTQDLNRWLSSN
ncbi:MAG: hypothetical protein VB933_03995 [Pseudomonadales bacterium]